MSKRSERRIRREARERAEREQVSKPEPAIVLFQNSDDEPGIYRKGTELLDEAQVRELERDFDVIVIRCICNRRPGPQDYQFISLN